MVTDTVRVMFTITLQQCYRQMFWNLYSLDFIPKDLNLRPHRLTLNKTVNSDY